MGSYNNERIVITGVGVASPNGDNLQQFRANLLGGVSGVEKYNIRYFGDTLAGVCHFDPVKYQTRKAVRIGTRAGSIAIYCANEAIRDAALPWETLDRSRVGVYLGITEHGNVETEMEIHQLRSYNYDIRYWSHYHNPRTVANNPAGEVTINMGITGPHYTIGAACAAGNAGSIQGFQQLVLGEVDVALSGGVSESIHTFGIFASFKSQNALAEHTDPTKASRPFDKARNGIVVSEGGAVYVLERLASAQARGAKIYGEIIGFHQNSDAEDMVLPNPKRQAECMTRAIARAGLEPKDIQLVNTHATGTPAGDARECAAIREVFGTACPQTYFNNTKSFIGHAMGAAGALELAGNLPAFQDKIVHPTINVDDLDPECALPNLVIGKPQTVEKLDTLLNNSFGMLGINSVLIVKRYAP
ncbi:MAG: beta-ketoacyl synthase [Lentisphaerae bacterium RIFOXYB12_FULL_65_16]|nr:MAG: beta-ketoacyl synthase [Lentisphaerae bacterium RIFOXYA12_64_32]OGV85632.1 MAG: beta-ketoacyl synthase [Lentisphaerae bacterium RIFOXYB12_FULL_65_16]